MLQEKYRVYITIKKDWFYKVPESLVTAGTSLFEGIGFTSSDYEDDPRSSTVHYDKMIDGSDIPELMSNYENFPLYGEASIARINLSITHDRVFEKPLGNEEDSL